MTDESLLLQYMGDTPKLRIIDFFLDNRGSDYSKKEIIDSTGMSKTTFYMIWEGLVRFGVVKETRKYGNAQLYALDTENPVVKKVIELDKELARQSMANSVKETKAAKA